ncbi:MAG: DUF4388 domain-containing protein [candidate division WOR-3 bacterium]|nr:DUF4388 domain-containing protein [candidate division WOR-3 bacterium]
MALEGNLEDFELTDVFQLIQLGAKDGSLRIQTQNDVGVVYFKEGMVVHARTNNLVGEQAIDTILQWRKGRFVFKPGEETLEKTVELPIQQVILDAARRIDELNKIQRLIPSFDMIPKIVEVPDAGIEKINLRPEEWKVLAFVDGHLSIREISQRVKLSEFETGRILYGLISSGLVKLIQGASEETKKTEPPPSTHDSDDEKKGGIFGIFKKK